MLTMLKPLTRAALTVAAAFLRCGPVLAQDVPGAGASPPAPIDAQWADAYHKATGARINDQPVGCGAGVRQIKARTVDFGATDAPLADEELARDGLVQFRVVIGGVVPVVNLPGVAPGQPRLSGALLGDLEHEVGLALHQLRRALDAFARLDVPTALQMLKADDQIDRAFEGLMRKLITFRMEDPRTISASIGLVFAAKAIERVGDHAKNLAEAVIYVVKGTDVRHNPIDSVESMVR